MLLVSTTKHSNAVSKYKHRLLRKCKIGLPSVRNIQGVLFIAGPSTAQYAASPVFWDATQCCLVNTSRRFERIIALSCPSRITKRLGRGGLCRLLRLLEVEGQMTADLR